MKCFVHPDRDAAGLCSQCGKAGCPECLRDVGGAMLCTNCLRLQQQAAVAAAADAAQTAASERQTQITRAKSRLSMNWLLTGLGGAFGFLFGFSSVLYDKDLSTPLRVLLAPLAGLFFVYWVFALVWGVPAAWNWWRVTMSKLDESMGCILFANPFTWLVLVYRS